MLVASHVQKLLNLVISMLVVIPGNSSTVNNYAYQTSHRIHDRRNGLVCDRSFEAINTVRLTLCLAVSQQDRPMPTCKGMSLQTTQQPQVLYIYTVIRPNCFVFPTFHAGPKSQPTQKKRTKVVTYPKFMK